jgi:hypothetical protein
VLIILSEDNTLGKEEFKEAFFNAVEALIEHPVSISGRSLIMSYFNDARGDTILERAIEAMTRYSGIEFPPAEERNKKLTAALNRLAYEAGQWDRE